jgi:hypothetical protein
VAAGPCWHLPRHQQWVWDGRPLAGQRVLVRCYHGLGDTIQFARFFTPLAALASELVIWAPPALVELLRTVDGVTRVLPLHDGAPEIDYDVDIESMEIPHALRVSLAELPARVPYFAVPAAERFSKGTSVGVVAQSGDWDASRSVPPELLATLPGVSVLNLQLGDPIPAARDISTPDALQLAARIRALDLVISVDTMVAHLAGALGVRTWTLLKADADWRWMDDRSDSPWYPTMRLFRQPRAGAWDDVLACVRRELAA